MTLTAGQTFRWRKSDQGWAGTEGDVWSRVRRLNDDEIEVVSSGTREQFEFAFRLDEDAAELKRELVRLGPELAPVIDRNPGLRMMRSLSPVQTLFSFLCTSNNHLSRIASMVSKLAAFGDREALPDIEIEGAFHIKFPSVAAIACIEESELRRIGFGYRGRTIPLAAKEINARGAERWLYELSKADYRDAREELMSLPGVGPKLADCIALFALEFTESVPFDVHMWRAFHRFYGSGECPLLTRRRYEGAGDLLRDRFGKLAGQAHQYLYLFEMQNAAEKGRQTS